MSTQRTMIVVWLLALVGLTLAAALQFETEKREKALIIDTQKEVQIGSTTVTVDVADTPALQAQGLSGRERLDPGTGMLFIFEEEGTQGIWMKDMEFAIDILWLTANGTIITIAEEVTPDTYPQAFHASEPTAKYVLEVPAGFVREVGVAVGQKVVVK